VQVLCKGLSRGLFTPLTPKRDDPLAGLGEVHLPKLVQMPFKEIFAFLLMQKR